MVSSLWGESLPACNALLLSSFFVSLLPCTHMHGICWWVVVVFLGGAFLFLLLIIGLE